MGGAAMRAPARRICDTPDACRAISPEVIFVTVSDKIIRLKTDLPVVPARVWDVLTGARHIEAWWGRHVALTPRAGGGDMKLTRILALATAATVAATSAAGCCAGRRHRRWNWHFPMKPGPARPG